MPLSEQECIALLPWFLNGTLSEAEKKAVSEQLSRSENLQQELSELKLLQQNLPVEEQDFPASTLGWKRLQKQIQSENLQSPQTGKADSTRSGKNSWFKPVAIAATFILSVQVGLFSLNQSRDSAENIQLLSGTPVVISDHQSLVQLSFSDDASWQQIQEILNTLNADLVKGPSAIGLLHIRFSLENVSLNGQAVGSTQEVIDWLTSQSIVEHAALEP